MKTIFAVAATAFAALVSAQLSQLPTCAQNCVQTNLNVPGCTSLQIDCICKNKDYLNNLSCCVRGACNDADLKSTITFASQICNSVNINLDTNIGITNCPTKNGTAPASSSASGTAASATSRSTNAAAIPTAVTEGAVLGGVAALFALL